jgi:type IV pilus secretin PilQ/predicted competence protein
MKRKSCGLAFVPIVLAVILSLSAQTTGPVRIEKISVEPDALHPRVVLAAGGSLRLTSASYAQDYPNTLIVEIAGATLAQDPLPPGDAEPLVSALKVEPRDNDSLRLLVSLKEKVPFRIRAGPGQTVLEFDRILEPGDSAVIDQAMERTLATRNKTRVNLQNVEVQDGADRISISARCNPKVLYGIFALGNPLRLVVDLYDTVYGEPTSTYPIEKYGVDRLKVGQFKSDPDPVTRMVFDLREPKLYSILPGSTGLTIAFAKDQAAPEQGAITPSPAGPPETASQPAPTASAPPNREAEPNPVPAAEAPPQAAVETAAQEVPSQSLSVSADQFIPKTVESAEAKYSGETLSVKFKDADLRDVVLYLCEFAGLNVVFDPDVKGRVTCDFEVVPWDQILDMILKQNKVGKVLDGNVLRIAPLTVLTREGEDERRLREGKENAGPLNTKTYPLSYTNASDVLRLLTAKKSSRGEIAVDARTNTLIITEVKERMDLMEKLLNVLDTPTPQVSIEARIVEATSTFVKNLGFQWGFKGQADAFYGNQTSLEFPNKILADGSMIPQGIVTKGVGGPLGGYAINLPAPSFTTALGLSFANVLDTFRLDMAITALETSGQGKIISSPKVTTQNNREAEIVQGRQIPVQTQANFTVSTRYVNAALELKATPQITAEGTIIMNIDIKNNAADFANLVNGIPPIITQSAKTTVMVPDGGTTVIGGIYRTEDSYTQERVPLLWKIPVLGNLFKSMARTKTNRELLIFLTPRIIK